MQNGLENLVLTLSNINDGAAERQFQDCLSVVLANIADPNTLPDVVRSITIKIEFMPTENRRGAAVMVTPSIKLAASKPIGGAILVIDGDKVAPYPKDTRQAVIMFDQVARAAQR